MDPDREQLIDNDEPNSPSEPIPTRSIYALTKKEIAQGIANRFVHSRAYIILYLSMTALSVTTIALSIADGCPGLAFYILEIIINTSMIVEVAIRFIAFGRQFWKSPFNIMDLIITVICAVTILVIFFAGCGSTSKEEELLDTLLLVARNVLQFVRLASVMRHSGQSIFSRPKPIDLRRSGRTNLDIDIEDDEEDSELGRPLINDGVLFDATSRHPTSDATSPMPRAVEATRERGTEDVWAELG
jgi:hypothetical protein